MTRAGMSPVLRGGNSSQEASEARFRQLFDQAEAMSIQGYHPDGTVLYWNRASELIYGYSREEALGANLLDLIIPHEMRRHVQASVRQMFESGRALPPGRLNLKHKNGDLVAVYSSHTLVTVPGEAPVLFCMDADMRELAHAETERDVAATAFESHQAMLVTDSSGRILRVNRRFVTETGYTTEDLKGKTTRFLDSDHHDDWFYEGLWARLRRDGNWSGEIWGRRKNGEIYPKWTTLTAVKNDAGFITHYVSQQVDITDRKVTQEAINDLAFYDSLTRLPNRNLLQKRLEQALMRDGSQHRHGAVFLIDLDDFNTINNTLGHRQGDLILQEVARRLLNSVHRSHTVARISSDEFVILVETSGEHESAVAAAEAIGGDILAALNRPYPLCEGGWRNTPSIGVTLFGEREVTAHELLKQASLAMQQAKARGRNTLCYFNSAMQVAVEVRAALEADLRVAISEKQFRLYYQAQVDVNDVLTGAEALLRWHHPSRGLILPGTFIPLAEDNGLIEPLGRWVLEAACRQLAIWATRPTMRDIAISVNVSARQFRQADFVAQVKNVLSASGAAPTLLKLEVTESAILDDVENAINTMHAIAALGVSFSMDDFGTGYSSLSNLMRLPLAQIKIDRSFMGNIPGDARSEVIAQTMISMGLALKMSVVAEGVEREAQRQFLKTHGCHLYQGYLISRALPLEAFEAFAKECSSPRSQGK